MKHGIWYWLGLNGPDGKPDNSKVCYTLAVFVALGMVVALGLKQMEATKGTVSVEYVALVCFVLLFAGSLNAFKKLMTLKFGSGNGTPTAPARPSGEVTP